MSEQLLSDRTQEDSDRLTLAVFVDHDLSIGATALHLGVSRKAVTVRVRRCVEKLLARSA